MNSERLRYREEREIDLFDMFIEVLLHWRGLIIAMIIGGLVLGGYSLYGSYKANASAKAAKAAAEEQAALSVENKKAEEELLADEAKALEEATSALTESQIANVDSIIIQQKQLQQAEKYAERSVLMKVDYNEVPKADITFKVEGDRSYDIAKAYEDVLTSAEMFKYVADKCGMGSEISECISLEERLGNLESPTDILKINVYAASLEKCEEIVNAFCEYANSKVGELQESLGEHTLSLVNKSVSTVYSKEIYDKQIANQNTIISLKRTIATAVDALKDEEKTYYELKTNAVIREDEEAEAETEIKPEEIVIPKISVDKKKLVVGLVGGLFLYALIICIGYIFNGKVKDSDDFERLFGIKTIGKIYGAGDKRANRKGLDGAIYSLKRRGRKPVVQNSAEKMIAINSAALASKEETKNVAIICGDFDAAGLIERIKETITTEEKNTEVFESLLYSSTEAQELTNIDSAIIVVRAKKSRYNETEETIKILENRGIKILGGVMA